jgi:hypothetical protein
MKLGVTGTRRQPTQAQLECFASWLKEQSLSEFHHGGCVGADAAMRCLASGSKTVCHPPTDKKYRAYTFNDVYRQAKPYLERNRDIVDETDMLVAMPGGFREELRSGTWATIRYARKLNRTVVIIWPNGSIWVRKYFGGEVTDE